MIDDPVAAAIRDVGNAIVVPRFRSLAEGEVIEKGPGDLVTIADRECEIALAARLREIRDIAVVGEEATAADPSSTNALAAGTEAWIIDPIDGTSNFVAGDPNFAVMVARVEAGTIVSGWIWHPETDTMLSAQAGDGARRNGEPLSAPGRASMRRGILKRTYMEPAQRERLGPLPVAIADEVPAIKCAGMEYSAVINGDLDFLFYWRTLPWDHAPGAIIATEAGLRVGRLDSADYRPGVGTHGILTAVPEIWDDIAAHILAAIDN